MRIKNQTDLMSVNEATPVLKSGSSIPKFMQNITLAAVVSVATANEANALDCRELPGIQSSSYKQATCDRLSPNIDDSHVVGFSTDGHLISYVNGKYVYSETNTPVDEHLLPDVVRYLHLTEEQRIELSIQRAKEVRDSLFRESNIQTAKEVREALLKSIEPLGASTDLSEEQRIELSIQRAKERRAELFRESNIQTAKEVREALLKSIEPLGASTDLSEEQETKYKQSRERLRKALETLAEEE